MNWNKKVGIVLFLGITFFLLFFIARVTPVISQTHKVLAEFGTSTT